MYKKGLIDKCTSLFHCLRLFSYVVTSMMLHGSAIREMTTARELAAAHNSEENVERSLTNEDKQRGGCPRGGQNRAKGYRLEVPKNRSKTKR